MSCLFHSKKWTENERFCKVSSGSMTYCVVFIEFWTNCMTLKHHNFATKKYFSIIPKDSVRWGSETFISGTFTTRNDPCTLSPRFQIRHFDFQLFFLSKNTDFPFGDLKKIGFIFFAVRMSFLNVSGAQLYKTPKIIL